MEGKGWGRSCGEAVPVAPCFKGLPALPGSLREHHERSGTWAGGCRRVPGLDRLPCSWAPPPSRFGVICVVSQWDPGPAFHAGHTLGHVGRHAASWRGRLGSLHSVSVEMDGSTVLDVADAGDTPRVICLLLI